MASNVEKIKAEIEKKKAYLRQVPTVKKELKDLEAQLKAAEIDDLAKTLSNTGIDIEALKRAIIEGNIVLPDDCKAEKEKVEVADGETD